MAASTIDPAIGASTWALGSHRWRPYKGIFTIKAIMHAYHRIELGAERFSALGIMVVVRICSDPRLLCINSSATSKGSEPIKV